MYFWLVQFSYLVQLVSYLSLVQFSQFSLVWFGLVIQFSLVQLVSQLVSLVSLVQFSQLVSQLFKVILVQFSQLVQLFIQLFQFILVQFSLGQLVSLVQFSLVSQLDQLLSYFQLVQFQLCLVQLVSQFSQLASLVSLCFWYSYTPQQRDRFKSYVEIETKSYHFSPARVQLSLPIVEMVMLVTI